MSSFALEHKKRVLAQQQKQTATEKQAVSFVEKSNQARRENPEYSIACDSIEFDVEELHNLAQGQIRNARKKDLIQKYQTIIDAYLAKDDSFSNPILVQVMIWAFDVNDIALADRLSARCIQDNQSMPERFKRDIKTYVADAYLEYAMILKTAQEKVNFLLEKFDLIKNEPIHDKIKAKYTKNIATLFFSLKEYQKSKDFFDLTLVFNPQAKITTALKELEKFL